MTLDSTMRNFLHSVIHCQRLINNHFSMSPRMIDRFENVFNNTDDTVLITLKNVHFVLINSVRMERDGCYLCRSAERKIENISSALKCAQGLLECENRDALGEYSRPVLLQVCMKGKLVSFNILDSLICSIFQLTVLPTQFA